MKVNLFGAYERLECALADIDIYTSGLTGIVPVCDWCSCAEKWLTTTPELAAHLRKIIKDVMDQTARYIMKIHREVSDVKMSFEELRALYNKHIDESLEVEYVVSIGVQFTHTDADGYGSAMFLQLFNNLIFAPRGLKLQDGDTEFVNVFTPVIKCPEYMSDAYICMGIDVILDMTNDIYPRYIFITDIPMNTTTIKAIGRCATWVNRLSHKVLTAHDDYGIRNQALYIDHHITNPLISTLEKDGVYNHGIFVCPNAGDLEKKGIKTDLPAECKTAATFVAYNVLKDNMERALADNETMTLLRKKRFMADLYGTALTISQWDTFEWRDHPELNPYPNPEVGITPTMIGNMEFEKPLICLMNDLFEHLWTDTDFSNEKYPFFDNKFGTSMVDHDQILKMSASKSFAISTFASSAELSLDGYPEDQIPDKWVIVPFPTLGNFSLICHYMMELEEYKELQKTGTVGVLAMDMMSSTISLRTNESIDKARVDKLAKRLGGGGHPQASGCHNFDVSNSVKRYISFVSANRKEFDRTLSDGLKIVLAH